MLLEELLTLPDIVYACLSPDGRWLAVTILRVDGKACAVFCVDTSGESPPQCVTPCWSNAWFRSWAHDSASLVVAVDEKHDERVFLVQIILGQSITHRRLTPEHPTYYIQGGVLDRTGSYLLYGANYDSKQNKVIETTWLYRQSLATGEMQVLAKLDTPLWIEPLTSHYHDLVLYQRADTHPAGLSPWIVHINGSDDHELPIAAAHAKVYSQWDAGGENLVHLVEKNGYKAVVTSDQYGNNARTIIANPNRMIERLVVSRKLSHSVIIHESVAAVDRSAIVNLQNGEIEEFFPLSGGNVHLYGLTNTHALAARTFSAGTPDHITTFINGEPSHLLYSITSLTPLVEATSITWHSFDGLTIQGWLYTPQCKPIGAVVYVHGGPQSHSRNKVNTLIQHLVGEGFVVLDPNYRGSTGFGFAFEGLINENGWGADEQKDIWAGIDTLIERGLATPGKIGITGISYGGYSSWWAATHLSHEKISAAAPICGMTDLIQDYNLTRPDIRSLYHEVMGGSPEAVPGKYQERSPLTHLANITARLLIVHGAQDPNVPIVNVESVVSRLSQLHIPHKTLIFNDEGHGILRKENQHRLLTELTQFFKDSHV